MGPGGRVIAMILLLWLGAAALPLVADPTTSPPSGAEDFGQYLAGHQGDLAPFFSKNGEDLFRLAVPVLMRMMGWVIFFTMLAGWAVDVLMSNGYAFFFAPAFAGIKRALVYATGGLFLSFVYACLMGLAIVFSLKFPHAGIVMLVALVVLALVALAAQVVWILYLYRTSFPLALGFYLALFVAHALLALVIFRPVVGLRASAVAGDFVDRVITPRLQAEVNATKQELADAAAARNAARSRTAELQQDINQARSDEDQLRQAIEEKKNSDVYIFSQIVQARARGELDSARDRLTAFLVKFPASPLTAQARSQLDQVNVQLAAVDTRQKQQEADAARATAAARADLLTRAGKGEVTLSEMRQALLGKTRAQVSSLLGPPSEIASDTWGYRQRMIINPVTNQRFGLQVYFIEGLVQGVDYDRNGRLAMNRRRILSLLAAGLALGPAASTGWADSKQLSPERLDVLDQLGYFTPGFKTAVHELVDTRQELGQTKTEQAQLDHDLPGLQKEAAEMKARTAALHQELAKYDHPEETDFGALQMKMNDTDAGLGEQIALAQAYVWTYPASPHEAEVQQYLQQAQKKLADQQQALKDAEAARAAAHAMLVQRAQARDLNLGEWRNFLRDMSQDDLVKLLGRPTTQRDDYWIYSGEWIVDPANNRKVGMEVDFNAGRVIRVIKQPHPQ